MLIYMIIIALLLTWLVVSLVMSTVWGLAAGATRQSESSRLYS